MSGSPCLIFLILCYSLSSSPQKNVFFFFFSVACFYLCPQIFKKNYKILKWREHRSHNFWVSTVYTVLSHGKLLIYTFSFKIYINVANQNVHSALLLPQWSSTSTTVNKIHVKHGNAKLNSQPELLNKGFSLCFEIKFYCIWFQVNWG